MVLSLALLFLLLVVLLVLVNEGLGEKDQSRKSKVERVDRGVINGPEVVPEVVPEQPPRGTGLGGGVKNNLKLPP